VCALLEGKKISANCNLWIFTSRVVRAVCDQEGYTKIIRDAGAHLLTDTCSAISQSIPQGTRVAALDSAKQTHYLPAFMGIEAWFGSTGDCVNAAITGRWNGALP
jgi:predicted aconitase